MKPISKAMDGMEDLTNREFGAVFNAEVESGRLNYLANSIQRTKQAEALKTQEQSNEKKPLEATFVFGGKQWKAFIDDITSTQERDIELGLAY
jgi:hypothetical protein